MDLFLQQQFLCQKFLHKKFLKNNFLSIYFLQRFIFVAYIFVYLIKMTIWLKMQKNIAQIRIHQRRPIEKDMYQCTATNIEGNSRNA